MHDGSTPFTTIIGNFILFEMSTWWLINCGAIASCISVWSLNEIGPYSCTTPAPLGLQLGPGIYFNAATVTHVQDVHLHS